MIGLPHKRTSAGGNTTGPVPGVITTYSRRPWMHGKGEGHELEQPHYMVGGKKGKEGGYEAGLMVFSTSTRGEPCTRSKAAQRFNRLRLDRAGGGERQKRSPTRSGRGGERKTSTF